MTIQVYPYDTICKTHDTYVHTFRHLGTLHILYVISVKVIYSWATTM
jgi:hypothetical protein